MFFLVRTSLSHGTVIQRLSRASGQESQHLGSSDKHWHLASFHFRLCFCDFFFLLFDPSAVAMQLRSARNVQMRLAMSLQEGASHVSRGLVPFFLTYKDTLDRRKQLAPRTSDDASLFGEICFQSNSAYSTSHSKR